MYKLGSLFDGSGGFPLAGSLCGITPVWASEVEPYPIAVTKSRFPDMKHLGDISKIHGGEIEPVDIISFGSPCQSFSVAGLRHGLKHTSLGDKETTRSGLFMEAIRIIKEMRRATNGKYPRFALFENVPGVFSSGSPKGEDFRIVLEEFIKIAEPKATVPAPPKGGWPYADAYVGDGWSLAYRTFDAQYWGVPQRRRRIYLVADFIGGCAPRILFEREGLRGHFETGRTPWQGFARDAEGSVGADDRGGKCLTPWDVQSRRIFTDEGAWPALYGGEGGGHGYVFIDSVGGQAERAWEGEVAPTLKATHYKTPPCVMQSAGFCTEHSAQAGGIGYQEETAPTLRAGTTPAVVYDARGNGDGEIAPTITGDHNGHISDYTAVLCEPMVFSQNQRDEVRDLNGVAGCLAAEPGMKQQTYIAEPVYCLQGNGIDRADTAECNGRGWKEDACYTLNTVDRPAVAFAEPVLCMAHGQANAEICENQFPTLNCNHEQPILIDRAYFNQGANAQYDPQTYDDGSCPTLVARGPHAVCVRYIVRRLTPTECARLQGFKDDHGCPDRKEDFTEEEYRFWAEVRNTHAAINGKTVKDYTKAQMVKWYNKLHSASAEYRMWGNGISLPTALYVMQGIEDALSGDPNVR